MDPATIRKAVNSTSIYLGTFRGQAVLPFVLILPHISSSQLPLGVHLPATLLGVA